MDSTVFDYAIIGLGAAGLHLALRMIDDPFFQQKQILLLEKDIKDKNDKTWCFWEKGSGQWNAITTKTWEKGRFFGQTTRQEFEMTPYRYKMIRSVDFYLFAKEKIKKAPNFHWTKEEITSIDAKKSVLHGIHQSYQAKHIFDSRIDAAFHKKGDPYFRLLQHFKGWVIETETYAFNPAEFVMMDFRLRWKDSTSFTYVLPISKQKALVEFTLFTPELIEDSNYDQMLKKYIKEYLQLEKYKVLEVEKGVIPMSNYPFHRHHRSTISKIGTAGGWVRPSTGYSFKNAERYAKKIVENIKKGAPPAQGIATNRFRKYDTLFLDLLANHNQMGEGLFSTMYGKNDIQKILKFLDEESSFLEDLQIMASFRPMPFLKAILNQLRV